MASKIKKKLKKDCECYLVGNKIVCFLVGRFYYLGKPSDKKHRFARRLSYHPTSERICYANLQRVHKECRIFQSDISYEKYR